MQKAVSTRMQIKTLEVRARMAELAGDHEVAKKERDIARKLMSQQEEKPEAKPNE